MTVVLVHGNPETAAVWDPMVDELVAAGFDVPVRLSPPGFGAPVPPGWDATVGAYRDWLVTELEEFNAPVDLVGHDWGGGHVLNVAMTRPDLMRTWCSDVVGVFDPDYVWHDLAQVWQRPGAGEDAVAAMAAAPAAARAAGFVQRGMSEAVAARVALGFDSTMADCILKLYRSAAQPTLAKLGAGLEAAAASPGLSIQAADDHMVGTDEQRRRSAVRAGARIAVLNGLGHWWMTQDPRRGAAVLTDFWRSV